MTAQQYLRIAVVSVFASLLGATAQDAPADHPVDKIRASIRLADDALTIECVAHEPDVVDPVAITWDEDGAMYVVEMRDYPLGPVGGTVRRLTDDDHDGIYEHATLFADGLPFPNSALAYNGGLLVTSAPDIWFLKDIDGDGVADERRVVLTGFGEGNQQLRINSLFWGLDNWIYAANGRSDGTVKRPDDPADKALPMRHHDLRFKADMSAIEPIAGFSQFGICQDDWGNRFLSWNTVPIRHVVLEERYLTRNPHLASTESELPIAENDYRIYPIAPQQRRFNAESTEFWNASCGLTIYRGDAMPHYNGNALVCESVTNLVHRMTLTQDGPTFIARRADEGKEFIASTDLWFRAVNLATGPDGALYIADFAREWVEHPDFVPKDMRDAANWRNGDTLGRIWRVRPKDWKPQPAPKLSALAAPELVKLLNHPNAWYRTQAQRLLVTRKDATASGPLKELARAANTPQGRIHALWTLEGIGALDDDTIVTALKDPDAHVRRQAVLASESHADSAKIADALKSAARDNDAAVRFQIAATAGAFPSETRLALCRAIAATDASNPWTRLAVLGSINNETFAFTKGLLEDKKTDIDAYAVANFDFLAGLAEIVGRVDNPQDIGALLKAITQLHPVTGVPDLALVSGLTKGLAKSSKPLRQWLTAPSAEVDAETLAALQRAFITADYVANKDGARDFLRSAAVVVLGQKPGDESIAELKTMLTTANNDAVRAAALDALLNGGDRKVTASLLEDWSALTVPARKTVVASLLSSPETTAVLLDALEKGKPSPAELEPASRETLKAYPVAELKDRAAKLFVTTSSPEKEALITKYKAALDLAGDKSRGAKIFAQNCMPCHMIQGVGQHVGPDLSGIATKPKERLIFDILDPSGEISPDFINYTVSTKDLEIVNGVLGGETASSVTIRQAAGIEATILRENIDEMTPSKQSLMPAGFESAVDAQGMSDLLEWLHHSDRATLEAAAAAVKPAQ